MHDEDGTKIRWYAQQGPLHVGGRGSPVRVVGHGHGIEGAPLQAGRVAPAAEGVVAGIERDTVQPRGERGIPPEPPQVAEAGEEGILCGVARVLGIPEHTVGEVVDAPLVPLHQDGKRLFLSLLKAADEDRIGQLCRCRFGHEGP